MNSKQLTFSDHSRHFNDCIYVYPVVSRRAEGVSLGINLNINNACNWRCVYCQVDGLQRGKPERMDLARLEFELDFMLEWLVNGDFLQQFAPPGLQRFNDVCLSGNGESTLSKDFAAVIEIIAKLRQKYALTTQVKTLLISNGSEIHQPKIQAALRQIAINNGELWFKIDRATEAGISQVNQVSLAMNGIQERLRIASELCPVYIQSCWFQTAGKAPDASEVAAFVELIGQVKHCVQGVLLYSTARNPALAEGALISQVSIEFLANLAARLSAQGISVKYYP